MRLIDADELMIHYKDICELCGKYKENNGAMCRCCYLDDAISFLEDMQEIEEQPTAEWIPCSERLPELHECKKYDMESSDYVLVYGITKDGESGVSISCYSKNYEGEGWCDAYIYIEFGQLEEIIAWMPLPEPYKAE